MGVSAYLGGPDLRPMAESLEADSSFSPLRSLGWPSIMAWFEPNWRLTWEGAKTLGILQDISGWNVVNINISRRKDNSR